MWLIVFSCFNMKYLFQIKALLPPQLQYKTFAIMRGSTANTAGSYFKIDTGYSNLKRFAQIIEVNGKTKLPFTTWPYLPISPNAERSGQPGEIKPSFIQYQLIQARSERGSRRLPRERSSEISKNCHQNFLLHTCA